MDLTPSAVPRLRMAGVRKHFGATCALKGVSFAVKPGEVHVLIGENGAGKSTLMKILSGAHSPDAGTVELDGAPFVPANPLHARRCGVTMIYQELNLAPHLSVEENILLGAEPARFGWLNRAKRRAMAQQALAELQHGQIPLDAPVNACNIGTRQIVEIARALVSQPKVLILDEPTSSLGATDTEKLFAVIRRLRDRGTSIIYISHFLEECQQIGDSYTILRDGESVATGAMADADLRDIIRRMVGRDIGDIYPRGAHDIGEPVLEMRGLTGRAKPLGVNLTLRAGEIFGLAGLIGAGRTETLRACFGLDQIEDGSVVIWSTTSTHASPSHRLKSGIGLLSEDRKTEGLMLNRSIADNMTVTRYDRVSRRGFVGRLRQQQAVHEWMDRLNIRARSPAQPIAELSGGNQQKVALGRLLFHQAKILLLDEPTRGIDIGSKTQIYQQIGQMAVQGKAVIFVSSYLPELLGMCDTIGVMHRGRLVEARPAPEWTEHGIMAAATGQSTHAA